MPSGKKSRHARRARSAPPAVRSKGAPRARRASPRALAIGGGLVVIAVVAVVLAVVIGGGGNNSGLPKNHVAVGGLATGLPGASDVEARLQGIPQNGTTLGWPSAPVTFTEYIDLQCPICQEFETTVFPDLVQRYVRTKKVKVVMKPWAFLGPDSVRGQAVALAAAKQNRAFNFVAVLYDNQGTENTGWLTDTMLYRIAARVPGLRIAPLFADRSSSAVRSAASQVAAAASADKVTGTPTLFINGTLFGEGVPDEAKLFQALRAAGA